MILWWYWFHLFFVHGSPCSGIHSPCVSLHCSMSKKIIFPYWANFNQLQRDVYSLLCVYFLWPPSRQSRRYARPHQHFHTRNICSSSTCPHTVHSQLVKKTCHLQCSFHFSVLSYNLSLLYNTSRKPLSNIKACYLKWQRTMCIN